MPRKAKRDQGPDTVTRSQVQPPRAPTGLPQGEHKALIDAQRQVPMANQAGRLQDAIAQAGAPAGPPLGGGDMMAQPTAYPAEPVTAGVPMGPGPGPTAVPAPAKPVQQDDVNMAKYLPMLEALADAPDTTNATRNFVRKMRGSLPPSVTMEGMVQQHTQPNG